MKRILQTSLTLIFLALTIFLLISGNSDAAFTLAVVLPVGFGPLDWPVGSENMGGYKNRLLFFPSGTVDIVPEIVIPESGASASDTVTAKGKFQNSPVAPEVLPTDAVPVTIYATKGTVQLSAENQGETDGQSFIQRLSFFHPGNKASVAAFARKVNNTPGYYVVEDPDGTQYMVGSKGLPCTMKPAFEGGAAPADRKGLTFTGEADSFVPYVILETKLDMETGTYPAP